MTTGTDGVTADARPYSQKQCDRIVLERLRAAKDELRAIPCDLLRHGADSAVTDLVGLALFNLELACRRISFDTYADKRRGRTK